MTIQSISLVVFKDQYGKTGFGFPSTYQRKGMMAWDYGRGIAHDIFEHVNGLELIGGLADELQAFGSGYFVRTCPETNQFISINNETSIEFFVKHLLARDHELMINGWGVANIDPDFNPTISEAYQITQEILSHIKKMRSKSYRLQQYHKFYKHFPLLFCYGYEKSKSLYENYPVHTKFNEVAETLEDYIQNNELIEGQEFTLYIDSAEYKEGVINEAGCYLLQGTDKV